MRCKRAGTLGGRAELRSRGSLDLRVEDVVDDERSSDDVVIPDLGSNALGGSSQVGEPEDDGEVDLAVLDRVSTHAQTLVDGDEISVLHTRVTDRSVRGVVGERGELGEGQGRVGLRAALDELEGGGVDGGERDGSVLGDGPGVALKTGRGDPGLVSGLGGQDRACRRTRTRIWGQLGVMRLVRDVARDSPATVT